MGKMAVEVHCRLRVVGIEKDSEGEARKWLLVDEVQRIGSGGGSFP